MKKSLTKISDFFIIVIYTKNGLKGFNTLTPLNVKSLARARSVSNTIMIYTQ